MGFFQKRNKKHGIKGAAHIKTGTAGSSNEISLSVLHAIKDKLDREHGEARRIQELGKIDLFTGNTDSDYEVPQIAGAKHKSSKEDNSVYGTGDQEENAKQIVKPSETKKGTVERSSYGEKQFFDEISKLQVKAIKSKRKQYKAALITITVVAFVLVVGIALFGIHSLLKQQNSFSEMFHQELERVQVSDSAVVQLNDALSDSGTNYAKINIETVVNSAQTAIKQLEGESENIERIKQEALFPSQHEQTYKLEKSVSNKKIMLDKGIYLLKCIKKIQEPLDKTRTALEKLDFADSQARQAAGLVDDPTEANLQSAHALCDQGIGALEEAVDLLHQVQSICPQADVGMLCSYFEHRRDALMFGKQAIEAILLEDSVKAKELQAKYEEEETAAKQLGDVAKKADQPILDIYYAEVGNCIKEYRQARDQAASADEYLRNYKSKQ